MDDHLMWAEEVAALAAERTGRPCTARTIIHYASNGRRNARNGTPALLDIPQPLHHATRQVPRASDGQPVTVVSPRWSAAAIGAWLDLRAAATRPRDEAGRLVSGPAVA